MKNRDSLIPFSLFFVAGLTIASFSPAQAGGIDKMFENEPVKDWYLGANVGQSKLEPNVNAVGGTVDKNMDSAYKVYGGYNFNESFAIEAFYADLGAAHADIVTDETDVDYQVYGAGLVWSLPMTNKLSVQGKLGINGLENKVKAGLAFQQVESASVYKSIGFEYRLSQYYSFKVEYDHFDKDCQLLSAGLQFNF